MPGLPSKKRKSILNREEKPPANEAKNGASEETRTLDIHLGKVTLYQLSYTRIQSRNKSLPANRQNASKKIGAKIFPLAFPPCFPQTFDVACLKKEKKERQ